MIIRQVTCPVCGGETSFGPLGISIEPGGVWTKVAQCIHVAGADGQDTIVLLEVIDKPRRLRARRWADDVVLAETAPTFRDYVWLGPSSEPL